MLNRISLFRRLHLACCVGLLMGFATVPLRAAAPSTEPDACDKVIAQYMAGKWDGLEAAIKPIAKQPGILTASQKVDIDYITQTLAECHPAWWAPCVAGKRTQIKVSIFKVPVTAVYDPTQKPGLNADFSDDRTFTLGLVPGELGSTQQAEHGFTKGELAAGGVWSALGMASGYVQLPMSSLLDSSDAEKLKLQRVLTFRGDLAAAYYGNPRSRQWWLFLALHYYKPQYQKTPIVMSRKAIGAMFVAELAAHPTDYPSIKLPANLDADHAEDKLVAAVHDRIERHGWTLAEDKLIREAVKAFALANASALHTGGPVKLANGLQISLEPKDDVALQLKRDQWLAAEFAKH